MSLVWHRELFSNQRSCIGIASRVLHGCKEEMLHDQRRHPSPKRGCLQAACRLLAWLSADLVTLDSLSSETKLPVEADTLQGQSYKVTARHMRAKVLVAALQIPNT